MISKSYIFLLICALISFYLLFQITDQIIKTQKRNNRIKKTKKASIKANKALEIIKTNVLKEISTVYDEKCAENVSKEILWIGMPKNLLLIAKGIPEEVKDSYLNDFVNHKYYYGGYKTLINTTRYKFEVIVEDEKVIGWNDL